MSKGQVTHGLLLMAFLPPVSTPYSDASLPRSSRESCCGGGEGSLEESPRAATCPSTLSSERARPQSRMPAVPQLTQEVPHAPCQLCTGTQAQPPPQGMIADARAGLESKSGQCDQEREGNEVSLVVYRPLECQLSSSPESRGSADVAQNLKALVRRI